MVVKDVLLNELSKFDHFFPLPEAKHYIHDLKCDEKWSQKGKSQVGLNRRRSLFEDSVSDELCYPACRVYDSHEPELVQAHRVIQVLVVNPSRIAQHHGRPPPG